MKEEFFDFKANQNKWSATPMHDLQTGQCLTAMSEEPQNVDVGLKQALSPRMAEGARAALTELVRMLLPELAQKVIQEEIRRIREEEMTLPAGEELTALIRDAFTPRLERITREIVRDLVRETLPDVAERLVREEIAKIRNP